MSASEGSGLVHLGDGSQTLCGLYGYQDDSGTRQRMCPDCSRWETHEALAADDEEQGSDWDDDGWDDDEAEYDDSGDLENYRSASTPTIVTHSRQETCPVCGGTGAPSEGFTRYSFWSRNPQCSKCKGRGLIWIFETWTEQ